jgi:glycosyltransferase involved in cell wall biosynthesis
VEASKTNLVDSGVRGAAVQWFGTKCPLKTSLVLPMFNEGPSVDTTMGTALAELGKHFEDYEIVVVDDASTDGCAQRVAQWVARDRHVRLVRLSRNQRFGGALRAGLAAATMDYIVYTDFDLQVGLGCLPQMMGEFGDADILTGYSASQVKHANWRSALISNGYNFIVRTLFGLQLRDINFGFKAMRKSVYDELHLQSRSPFVDAEMFVQAQALGCIIKEVPVPFFLRQAGVSHIRRWDVIAWTFWDMLCVRCRLWLRRW